MNMIARCPQCSTPFRVTPRQLKARSGKVRCGSCKAVFNGLEHLLEEAGEAPAKQPSLAWPEQINAALGRQSAWPDTVPTLATIDTKEGAQQALPIDPDTDSPSERAVSAPADMSAEDLAPSEAELVPPLLFSDVVEETVADHGVMEGAVLANDKDSQETIAAPQPAPEAATEFVVDIASEAVADAKDVADQQNQGSDQVEQGGRNNEDSQANSVREVRDVPGYNRWAETALSLGHMQISTPTVRRSLAARALLGFTAALLTGLLTLQAAYVWRVEIAARLPDSKALLQLACAQIGCEVPLPSEAEFVTIDASSLHIDPERAGTVVLEATLRNSAAYAQKHPLLELTLTDAHDRPLARRVLHPADYLNESTAGALPGFAGRSEVALRLWIDTADLGASGYRLFLFYAPASKAKTATT